MAGLIIVAANRMPAAPVWASSEGYRLTMVPSETRTPW
jgi:hypothetical protein